MKYRLVLLSKGWDGDDERDWRLVRQYGRLALCSVESGGCIGEEVVCERHDGHQPNT